MDKACVGYDARKTKPVCSTGCNWRADEAKIKDIDEKPVQEYVQWRGDEEDAGARLHDPLRLQIFLRGFEVDVAQSAGNQPAKEERGLLCEDGVLSELQEDALGEPPEYGYGKVEKPQYDEGALQEDPELEWVFGPCEGRRAKRVERGCAAEGYEPGCRHGEHVREGCGG